MTNTHSSTGADRTIKPKQQAVWAAGDYNTVASDFTLELGRRLVQAANVQEGDQVLDIAAGTGAVAIPAAQRGARVTATDLTPELIAHGRAHGDRYGLSIQWDQADAEALPFADQAFDVVLSSIGVMFAPQHQVAADEFVRVCRIGGLIGLLSWTPEGFLGQLMKTLKPYVPPPPPGAQPPALWGTEEHVQHLLGRHLYGIHVRKETLRVDHFPDGESFRDYFKTLYGPIVSIYAAHADNPEQLAGLDHDIAEVAHRHDLGDGVMEWEYLIFIGRVAY